MTAPLLLLRNADVYAPEALGRRHLLLGGGKVLWMGAHEPDLPALRRHGPGAHGIVGGPFGAPPD